MAKPPSKIAPASTFQARARARIGRPPKDRASILAVVYDELRAGQSRAAASAFAGITAKTLWEWAKSDPQISDRLEIAEALAERSIVSALVKAANGGEYTPGMYWLRTRRFLDWNEKTRIEVNVSGDVRHTLAFDPLIAIESRAQDVTDLVTIPAEGNGNGNGHAADILIG